MAAAGEVEAVRSESESSRVASRSVRCSAPPVSESVALHDTAKSYLVNAVQYNQYFRLSARKITRLDSTREALFPTRLTPTLLLSALQTTTVYE